MSYVSMYFEGDQKTRCKWLMGLPFRTPGNDSTWISISMAIFRHLTWYTLHLIAFWCFGDLLTEIDV